MTKQEQRDFIAELIENIKGDIIKRTNGGEKIPDDWDGIELRWLIRDSFSTVVFGGYTDRRSKRYKDYSNIVIMENLI